MCMKNINKTLMAVVAASTLTTTLVGATNAPVALANNNVGATNKVVDNSWIGINEHINLRSTRTNQTFYKNFDYFKYSKILGDLAKGEHFKYNFDGGSLIEFLISQKTPVGTRFTYNLTTLNNQYNLGFKDSEIRHMEDVRLATRVTSAYKAYYYNEKTKGYDHTTGSTNDGVKTLEDAKKLRGPNGEQPSFITEHTVNGEVVFNIVQELPQEIYVQYVDFWTDSNMEIPKKDSNDYINFIKVEISKGIPLSDIISTYDAPPESRPEVKDYIITSEEYDEPFETEYRDNPNLDKGEERVIREGVTGRIRVTHKQPTVNGKPIGDATSHSEYLVQTVNAIIECGTRVPDYNEVRETRSEEPIPFETEMIEDPNLPAGEVRLIQEGINGVKEVITKQPMLNGQPDGQPEIIENVITPAVNEIYHTGTGTSDKVSTITEEVIPYKTIYQQNKNLPAGERNTIQEGKHGRMKVETIQNTFNGNPVGEPSVIKTVIEDKIDEIIEIGSGIADEVVITDTFEIPFETRYVNNDDLPKGEERVVQNGEKGQRTVTKVQPRFNGEDVGEPTVSETITKEPVDKIIEIGTGVSHEEVSVTMEDIPYETERVEDPDLPKGEEHVVRKGVTGIIRITTKQVFKNGQPVGDPTVSRDTLMDPINEIIHIGVKEDDKPSPGVNESSSVVVEKIPFETERRENPDLPEGEEHVLREGVEGEKEIITHEKRIDGVLQGDPSVEERITKKPVNRIIEVGTKKPDIEEEVPFEVEKRENPELPEGTERVVREGKPGRKVNSKVVEEPVKKIVEVGTKKLDVEEEIPFEVEKRDNPNLPEGEERVVQEGKPGRKVNGKVVEEPVNKIVEVGTKKQIQDQNKPDVKTGVSDIATNPTLLTTLGLTITGILSAIGIKKRKDN